MRERGYANTSLRDIAKHTRFTHGVVHYYFATKGDLILYAMRQHKDRDRKAFSALLELDNVEEFLDKLAGVSAQLIVESGRDELLWSALRTEARFDDDYIVSIHELEQADRAVWDQVLQRYAELTGQQWPALGAGGFAKIEGLRQYAALAQVDKESSGSADDAVEITTFVRRLLPEVLTDLAR